MTAFALCPLSIIAARDLKNIERSVLLALHSFRGDSSDWTVWPSREAIAKRCNLRSITHVSTVLHRLESKGWLTIRRRRSSSVYALYPEPRRSPMGESLDVHECVNMKRSEEETQFNPPISPILDDRFPAVGVIEQPEYLELDQGTSPGTVEPSTRVEESHQGEGAETTDQGEAVQVTESVSAPDRKPRPTPEQRLAAVQKVLDAFRATSGIDYSNRPATERRIGRRIAKYGEGAIVQAIQAKGQAFRHPISILRPSILESVLAEIERDESKRQQAIERDQAALDELRRGTGQRTKEGAQKGIQMLRQAVGLRPKPDADGQMRA